MCASVLLFLGILQQIVIFKRFHFCAQVGGCILDGGLPRAMVAVNSMDPIELKKLRVVQLCLMRVIYVPSEFVEYMAWYNI